MNNHQPIVIGHLTHQPTTTQVLIGGVQGTRRIRLRRTLRTYHLMALILDIIINFRENYNSNPTLGNSYVLTYKKLTQIGYKHNVQTIIILNK